MSKAQHAGVWPVPAGAYLGNVALIGRFASARTSSPLGSEVDGATCAVAALLPGDWRKAGDIPALLKAGADMARTTAKRAGSRGRSDGCTTAPVTISRGTSR
jgi:hypothetical protein